MKRRLDIDGYSGDLVVRFGFDEDLVARVRVLPEARFSRADRAWFVPAQYVEIVVNTLTGRGFSMGRRVRELLEASATGERSAEGELPSKPTLTVASLNARVQHALRTSFESPVWVVGEIASLRQRRRGGMFFELVQRADGGGPVLAKVAAVIFGDGGRRIERTLAKAGVDVQPADGLQICARARVELYEATGRYQLVVDDIDPLHTLGHLAQRREATLRALRAEGIAEHNLRLPMPELPLRVGLVTSHDADAYADFVEELRRSGLGFRVLHCNVRVQGELAEPTITAALRFLAARAESLDVVAIVRGGGARTDLAAFDSAAIGRAVCLHPTPVVVGIGHQNDRSALDDVARSLKTPTAVAASLVDAVQNAHRRVSDHAARLRAATEIALDRARDLLARRHTALERSVGHHLELARQTNAHTAARITTATSAATRAARREAETHAERVRRSVASSVRAHSRRLDAARQTLRSASARQIPLEARNLRSLQTRLAAQTRGQLRRASERLDSLDARRRSLDPDALLRRGFAVVRRDDRAVRRAAGIEAGDNLSIHFADGVVPARALDHPEESSTAKRSE